MIRISQLKLPITHTKAQLEKKIAKTLKNPGNSFTYEIKKQSLDCRHKNDKIFVYTVDVTIRDEQKLAKKVNNNNMMLTKEKPYEFPSPGETPLLHSPVIVGSGPAGLFCGWYLAKAGYCPIILERGEEAEKRQKTVENFWKNGVLDPAEALAVMQELATEAGDEKLGKMLSRYEKNPDISNAKKIAGMLCRSSHLPVITLLGEKIREAASVYPDRDFGRKQNKYLHELMEKAERRKEELEAENVQTLIYREEPFIYDCDSISFQVYLMIVRKGVWKQKIMVEKI